jgi:hypothetical protein
MLGDTQKVLRGFEDAGYQVVETAIALDNEGAGGSDSKKALETGWRILTGDRQCVGVVVPTPTPRRFLGKTLCFGEPWFHTEPDAVELEHGWDAACVAERILGQVGRGGVFHGGKVWQAGSGNGIGSILRASDPKRS